MRVVRARGTLLKRPGCRARALGSSRGPRLRIGNEVLWRLEPRSNTSFRNCF